MNEGGDATLLNTGSNYQKIEPDPAGIWLLTVNSEAAELWNLDVLLTASGSPTPDLVHAELGQFRDI